MIPCLVIFCLILAAGVGPLKGQTPEVMQVGQELYVNNCADCHRTNGEGLPVKFPSLKGSPLVLGEPGPLLRTIIHGRRGQLGLMPAWAEHLNDAEIAALATYIRNAWGNKAPAVTAAQAAAARKP